MTQANPVAFLGMGAMGSALARHLLTQGIPVTVWNRNPERCRPLVDAGASQAQSPAQAALGAKVAITMLADDAANESVVFGPDGLLGALGDDQVHVAMSTISVALAERLRDAHRQAGRAFVAAPVLGRPEMAAQGKLFVALAGAPEAREHARPTLAALSQKIFDLSDDPAAASLSKLIANFLITTVIEGLAESLALARKGGLAPEALLELLTGSIFNAPVFKTYGGLIAEERYQPAGFGLPLGQKDNRLVLQAAEAAQVPLPLASLMRDRFLGARARGWDDLDWSAVARLAAMDAGLSVQALAARGDGSEKADA